MAPHAPRPAPLLDFAREALGYERFRPGQEEGIEAVLAGRDTLAVLPSGLGKSAIYQLAGALIDGLTLVVSPLIALQRDQMASINGSNGLPAAAALNSTLPAAERRDLFGRIAAGEVEFLFLAPEQFANDEVMAALRNARPSLFVVDEAHCIFHWGHDFRPEYLRLGTVARALGSPVILALTATAGPLVRREIIERLGMDDPAIVVRGFDRPNIHFAAHQFADDASKREALVDFAKTHDGCGIVYAATRKRTEDLAALVAEAGVPAVAYHAGMPAAARAAAQTAFMDGAVRVIVATTAFGMGIDKRDVRFVLHFDISDSVDSYYQEVGRAGRDAEPAEGRLLFRSEDMAVRRFFAGSPELDDDDFAAVLAAIGRARARVDVDALRNRADLPAGVLRAALDALHSSGAVAIAPDGAISLVEGVDDGAAGSASEAADQRRTFERTRLEMIRGYAETRDCRREFLLSYLGEAFHGPCGHCDNCDAGSERANNPAHQPFALQCRVHHEQFGVGSVVRYEPGRIVVLFDTGGYRTLNLDLVLDEALLRAHAEAQD